MVLCATAVVPCKLKNVCIHLCDISDLQMGMCAGVWVYQYMDVWIGYVIPKHVVRTYQLLLHGWIISTCGSCVVSHSYYVNGIIFINVRPKTQNKNHVFKVKPAIRIHRNLYIAKTKCHMHKRKMPKRISSPT